MASTDIKVPNIGDFSEVTVIELMVKPGDTVAVDQSLITVESDKASMEIPSSHAGVVKELKVKLGDKVAEGSLVLTLEAEQPEKNVPAENAKSASGIVPSALSVQSVTENIARNNTKESNSDIKSDLNCDLLVLGAGPGGYSAAFRAADLGLNVVLVERYATLGGVCLNVGCIPSKAVLHVAAVMDEVSHMGALGIEIGAPKVNIDTLRGHKEKVIGKLTGGLIAMAKMRKVTIVRSNGAFVDANHVAVEETSGTSQERTGKTQTIAFKKGLFPWAASGRAIANGRDEGVTKLVFDDSPEAHGHANILGGGMVGTHAGDMIGEIALAIEMGADAVDIGKTIHPHPTLGESIGMAAEVAHGSCTDLPSARK